MPLLISLFRTTSSLRHSTVPRSHSRFFKSASNTTVESTASSAASSGENVAVAQSAEKERMLTRLKLYWKALYRDYKDVLVESLTTIKNNPLKSSVYGTLAGSLYYCCKTNPDERMFRSYLLSCANKMSLIGAGVRNPKAADHLTFIEGSYNARVVRWMSLGIISLIWLDDHSSELCVYKAICPHLGLDYFSFHQRILDVGFLGRWWILEKKMEDYDINPDEWPVAS
ncbi:unnamed protein product [Bemisia tabaci]|uniref:Mitochondrial import inner membrane translocase subunit Tim29 n=1 Tax=Bemisia tabaci TaxID=7038 RepID=A0A9P0A6D3_BEMTA|nr:unnamed protein product [Bemisia tabaci]